MPSLPSPPLPPATAAVAIHSLLFLLSVASTASSGFVYPTCDGCYCIAGAGNACPTDDEPQTTWLNETLSRYRNAIYLNPLELPCDPYTNATCETIPPRTLVELGDDAVCGIKYGPTNTTSSCPDSYEAISYRSICEMEEDGAVLTHWGACGTCSSLRDLASFIEVPDLVDTSVYCFLNENQNLDTFVQCYMDRAGFSKSCATQFARDSDQTRANRCSSPCISKYTQNRPNNGPPPNCTLDECLICNEEENGPIFEEFGGRTRRRANLLSAIVRPCGELLPVEHLDPCNATADANATCSEVPSAGPTSTSEPSEVPSAGPTSEPSESPSSSPSVKPSSSSEPSVDPTDRPPAGGAPSPTSGSSVPSRTVPIGVRTVAIVVAVTAAIGLARP